MAEITQIQLSTTTYDIADSYSRMQLLNKADNTLATTTNDGLFSKEDKIKLNNLTFSVSSEILKITF